uniref:Uncharacterized protein n=1 Tax=Haematobia irritans TaxID=7368 RepID=A0A1L8E912_HAEIR
MESSNANDNHILGLTLGAYMVFGLYQIISSILQKSILLLTYQLINFLSLIYFFRTLFLFFFCFTISIVLSVYILLWLWNNCNISFKCFFMKERKK